jgi:deoxyadenosine/deoxycytidine kinase
MAKIVELFGPPGVGKTTIANEIDAKWEKTFPWIPARRIYPPLKKGALSPLVKYDLFNRLLNKGNIDYSRMRDAEKNFIAANPKLMDAYWKNICYSQHGSVNGIDIRFEKSSFLEQRIQKVQFLNESKTNKICLIDEGIVHMIPGAIYKSKDLAEEQNEIYLIIKMCPLPIAIINIDTDTKEIANRLFQRGKVNPMHRNLNLDELELVTELSRERRKIIIKILGDMGMPMLEIDSSMNSSENADKIIAFLNSDLVNKAKPLENNLGRDPVPTVKMV